MSREFEVREQLCFVSGENCLNRLVLDDDALGHQRVDAITHFNLDPFIPDVQGNFAADLDTPATKFMGEACLIRRLQQAGPQCSVHLEHGVHHALGNLLDLFLCLIRLLFPSRSLRLRGEKWNPLDMFRARAIVLVRIVRPQTTSIVGQRLAFSLFCHSK